VTDLVVSKFRSPTTKCQAPTGAGKTTIVPLALLESGMIEGKATWHKIPVIRASVFIIHIVAKMPMPWLMNG